jgi:hypothetical protein
MLLECLIVFLIFFAVSFENKVILMWDGEGVDICSMFGGRERGYALREGPAEMHQL